MSDKIFGLRRAVEFGLQNGKSNMIVELDVLREVIASLDRTETYARMMNWLDAAEGRTLMLVSANADFDGPSHVVEYSTLDHEPKQVFGETRDEIMDKIERAQP